MALSESGPVSGENPFGDGPLVRRVSRVVGHINAANAELVALLGEVLAADAWQVAGVRSPEHWATWRCGVSPAHARRLVAAARALADLPETAAVFAAGEIGEDQFAEVVRSGVGQAQDGQAAELARFATVPQLRRVLAGLPRPTPAPDPEEPEPTRKVSFGHNDDGTWWGQMLLPAEEGALVEAGLRAGRDAEFRDHHPDADAATEPDRVSWADGLIRLVHAGLDHLDPATAAGRPPGERYQVHVHVHPDTDTNADQGAGGGGGGGARLHLGPLLGSSVRRYLSCDATVRLWLEHDTKPVGLGRRQRTVNPKLRTVIEDRDGGCVVPGCAAARWLHIHHLVHWEHGGPTETWNLLAVCTGHHRMIHRGALLISGNPDQPDTLVFRDDHGRILGPAPPTPPRAPPDQAARRLGITDPHYLGPTGEQLDEHCIWWHDDD